MALEETVLIDREYVDNYSIKDFSTNVLVPKYFPDIDVDTRTSGVLGYLTEQVANLSEDAFNTGTVLFRETFANRAQVTESIYSHAALFQISDEFAKAAYCTFLLVLEEEAIVENMKDFYDKDTGIYHFYIDKNTVIYVKDIPFTMDYDVEIRIVKKTSGKRDEYLFTASYMMNEYKNSISSIRDPYIKIRRSNDGYIALELSCHQCIREIAYEPLLTNSIINYPTIDVNISGKLAGFDVLYKTAYDENYSTQLKEQVTYSHPSTEPFCYYTMKDEETLRITFNSKDGYFTPEFNSELKIILYLTEGDGGNFDVYNGEDISISVDNSTYAYGANYIVAAKPMSEASGGADETPIDALQALAVQGYRTALALTTEADLMSYFSTFKYTYGNSEVLFIKKRDDVYERVFNAFMVMRKNSYIFNTNTLNLLINLAEMENPEETIYILEPGLLFTANENDGFAKFFRDPKKTDTYYKMYVEAIENGEADYTEGMDQTNVPDYLDRPCSFAEFKRRRGLEDKVSIFDIDPLEYAQYDDPSNRKFLLINPFLIRFKKQPNLVSLYLTYVDQSSLVDFCAENEDSYVQFVMYQLSVVRKFYSDKSYDFQINLMPTIAIDNSYPIIDAVHVLDEDEDDTGEIEYKLNQKYNVVNNDLRVIMVIGDDNNDICFTELYPSEFNPNTSTFVFRGKIHTDDHITSNGRLRIKSERIYRNLETEEYYKVYEHDATKYYHYDKNDTLLEENISINDVTPLINDGTLTPWEETVNMTDTDNILIPMANVVCKLYMLYRRSYSEATSQLEINHVGMTNNQFHIYDKSLQRYIWTNEYQTISEPITFVKPLNSVRCNLEFMDFTGLNNGIDENGNGFNYYKYDILDATIYSIPFLRWSTALDDEMMTYFLKTYMDQYVSLTNIINTELRNITNLDVKFYNTYGRSRQFVIGEEEQLIDTVNLHLVYDVWFIPGTDSVTVIPEIKRFIKEDIETINTEGMNSLYNSNLMRKIEETFTYVDHIRFRGINKYDPLYQAVKNYTTDLNELTVSERRAYVPEILVVNEEDITINEYFVG